ncbi:uncharacterized protein LTR77_011244 [Saxophila tyrrhenica]|uniref:Uncharacterized protein n=1 Tax=Saxophila tyrrhenica TaxID=1690608 RepID=A0AAV9NX17_9PEZI|nr:hypothetical protein LTR77_011244 [Saxophila tyrrhenica]
MALDRNRGISKIPSRVRDRVDTSIVTTVSAQMRYMCMDVTMEMVRKLEAFGEDDRGLMMVAYNVPIKVMNVGLYPYEQNILPAIASALAYSPMTCIGATPSVQILSQAMAAVGASIKDRAKYKKKHKDSLGDVTEHMLMSKFAMLLRCSYLCSTVGVAFTNCVPISVNTMAKRITCASFFSEWLGEMIKIHNQFDFKMTIMAMGAFAADTVRRTFSSYRGTAEMVTYIGITNPAAISYMNVQKYTISSPIPHSITTMELDTASIVNWQPTLDSTSSYDWKMYPKSTLLQFMNEKTIGPLTRALIDHTAEELFDYFSTMAKNLFNNASMGAPSAMNANAMPAGALTSNMPENAPPGSNMGSATGRNQNAPATGGIFGKGQDESGNDARRTQPPDGSQIYSGRNSMLVQMTDPAGKNKTQQVIMVENMIGRLDEILESFRAREKREDRIEEKIDTLVDRTSYDDEELLEVMDAYKKSRPEMIKEMENAVAVAAALPTIFEGVVGAIENEIQPSAPLMRRYDGTTMRDAVYVQMSADRDSGVAQSRNPPTSGNIFANPNVAQNQASNVMSNRGGNPNTIGSTSQESIQAMQALRDTASNMMMSAIEALNGSGDLDDDGIEAMTTTLFVDEGEDLDMREILIVALMRYMKETSGGKPTKESMEAIIDMMRPFTKEIMNEVGHTIRDGSLAEDDRIVTFFDTAASDE